jgi:hypothetical protein
MWQKCSNSIVVVVQWNHKREVKGHEKVKKTAGKLPVVETGACHKFEWAFLWIKHLLGLCEDKGDGDGGDVLVDGDGDDDGNGDVLDDGDGW